MWQPKHTSLHPIVTTAFFRTSVLLWQPEFTTRAWATNMTCNVTMLCSFQPQIEHTLCIHIEKRVLEFKLRLDNDSVTSMDALNRHFSSWWKIAASRNCSSKVDNLCTPSTWATMRQIGRGVPARLRQPSCRWDLAVKCSCSVAFAPPNSELCKTENPCPFSRPQAKVL